MNHHVALLESFRNLHDSIGELWALQGIGQLYLVNQENGRADSYFRHAQELACKSGDLRALGFSERALATSARRRGDMFRARLHLREAQAIFERLEYVVGIGFTIQEMAHCEMVEGNLEEARRLAQAALIKFGYRYPLGRAWTLATLAQIESQTGCRSDSTLAESHQIFRKLGVEVDLSRPQVRYMERIFQSGSVDRHDPAPSPRGLVVSRPDSRQESAAPEAGTSAGPPVCASGLSGGFQQLEFEN
jgi:hypothetical protein